ncbi:hypothetical protein Glove_481g104 [Diversispora epigaea]|uniref:Ubiquitin-like domain-containing protein n=1 Tax=Diversispora epigaea TaxID=1348612 RepID=A0A397GNI8_9GLOM|nr:hypothetical protein Glove_481g104 [Diversispora epigaea]
MRIYVKTLKGKPISVVVEPCDKILKIKQIIEEIQGIPPDVQRLYFFGEILEDNKPISFYKIRKEFTLHLKYLFRGNMKINVEVKNEAPLFRKILKVDVKLTDTFRDIKNRIPYTTTYTQLYYYNKKLEDDETLSDHNIKDDSTIACHRITLGGKK